MATTTTRPMTAEEKKVIFASSLGTVFEWYDFYLYGSLAAIIAKQFFAGLDPTSAFIFALLAFAAGFIVRPFGALVFGRLGDMIGRKYTFLVTILLMGASTSTSARSVVVAISCLLRDLICGCRASHARHRESR
jgi:MFS family permease